MSASTQPERAKPFFANPSRYVHNNPYIALRAKLVREMLPPFARKSVLDLGCGDGRISIPLVGDNDDLLLVDSSRRMLDLALSHVPPEASSRVRGVCINVARFEPDRAFDVVLCLGVLAHLDDWVEGLRLIARCVAPGGFAVIQLTDQGYVSGRLTRRVGEVNRRFFERSQHAPNYMTLGDVEGELRRGGLSPLTTRRYALLYGLRFVPPRLGRALVRLASWAPVAGTGGEVLALFAREAAHGG
jgi:SAM-dependent methyltransferase